LASLCLAVVGFYSWWTQAISPVSPSSQEIQLFNIPQGWGVDQIAQELEEEGLIKNKAIFKIMVLKQGISQDLQAGSFYLSPSLNLTELTQKLTHGTQDIRVLIPEGVRKEEIATRIAQAFNEAGSQFNQQKFLQKTNHLEGYLFPDTYLFPKQATVEEIIKILTNNFEVKSHTWINKTALNQQQIVTLASLVEREAKYEKDRSLIAGVLMKRLREGWPLQVDASIQYFKAEKENWWPKVSPLDLEVDSSYNSYQNLGLPPTPICNPGLASLQAAAAPQESEYWFYLSDSSGQIHYARTHEEHQQNIEKYLN